MKQEASAGKKLFRASVDVMMKPTVVDPQGQTICFAATSMNLVQDRSVKIDAVRAGKHFEIALAAKSKEDADSLIKELCEKLLANPVIEYYVVREIELVKGTEPGRERRPGTD